MTKSQRIIYLVLTLAIFAYLAIRSVTVGIVNDEALSFLNYMRTGNIFPFTTNHHLSANNHILNSLLGWLSYKLFGIDEWVIRLPNLLSFALYSWAIYHIGLSLKSNITRWLFWTFLFGGHYLLEFFAYSRGYGISLAFLSASILFLIRASKDNSKVFPQLFYSLLMLVIGTLANLNLMLSLLIWAALALPFFIKTFKWKWFLLIGTTLSASLLFFILWSFELREHGELYFGQGNLRLTFYTILQSFTSIEPNDSNATLLLIIFASTVTFVLLMWAIGIHSFFKKPYFDLTPTQILSGFFILNILGSIVLNVVLDVNFPVGRTTLHWYFFLTSTTPFCIEHLTGLFRKLALALTAILFFPVLVYSSSIINISHSADRLWAKEQISNQFAASIQRLNTKTTFPLSLQASTSFYTYILAFQNFQLDPKLQVCDDFDIDHPEYIADLVLVDTNWHPKFTEMYSPVIYEPYSKMGLYKRNPIFKKVLILDTVITTQPSSNKAFTALLHTAISDSLHGQPLRVDYEIVTTSKVYPLPAVVNLELRDCTGASLWYKQQRIDYHYDQTINDTLKLSLIHDKVPENTAHLRSFFWNLHDESFVINSARVRLYKLKEP